MLNNILVNFLVYKINEINYNKKIQKLEKIPT